MTLLERIAHQRTNDGVSPAISLTLETIAAEVSRDLLRDRAFREDLKTIARQSLTRKPRARRK